MSKTHTDNGTHKVADNQGFSTQKPFVSRVIKPDGSVLLVGVTDAARWLGVKQPALSQLARGKNAFPITWEARARAEFPELFGAKTISGNVSPDAP